MSGIYKLLITIAVLVFMLYGGYHSYIFINRRIKESDSIWELLGYSLLLFITIALIFFGGLFIMAKVYLFLA